MSNQPLVDIIMGSDSDLPTLEPAVQICQQFKVAYGVHIVSAHRTPMDMVEYARSVHEHGVKVIIAAAGGAAHLPGMVASLTPLPVIGVPVMTAGLNGMDSLLSIVQMPAGVPVATVAIGGGKNAGLLAIEILAIHDDKLRDALLDYKHTLAEETRQKKVSL